MSNLTDRLNAIKALALRDLESTSDEQIRAEFVEDKQDPPEVARRVAASLARVVERTSASQHAMTAIDAQRSEIDRLRVTVKMLQDDKAALRETQAKFGQVQHDLLSQIDALREQYESACKLVADMHAAAMGAKVGPALGVVEDVAALRAALAQAMKERSRAIAVGDDMEQEVDRLREKLALAESVRAAQVAGLTEGMAKLEQDAARWRTLVKNSSYIDYLANDFGALVSPPFRRWYHDSTWETATFADAIDASLKGEA
jgi:predicted  nucleic acid-binding Zn-ribbon protein